MRAYEIPQFGLEHLRIAERDVRPLAATEVRVRARAVSLNYRDLLTVNGKYNPRQALPLVPCSDGAGEIIEIGPGVSRVGLSVGARVMSVFAQRWLSGAPTPEKLRSTLGGPLDGVLAEEWVLDQEGLVVIPEHLSFAEAATLPCAALTAWNALEQAALTSGQTVLVQGTGGVALFALQFAKLRGSRVIVTSKSDEKLARARALGADETINYVRFPDWGKAARKLTDGEGVDAVIEVGGADTLAQSVRLAKPGGCIALIGVLSGVVSELPLTPILMQNLRIQGVMVGHREMFLQMTRAVAYAKLRPVIGLVHAFADAPHAFSAMTGAAHFGKIVIEG